jgi:hypothetical protein
MEDTKSDSSHLDFSAFRVQIWIEGLRSRYMTWTLKFVAKFVTSLLVMTIVCTIVWQTIVADRLYDCTDGGLFDYLTPGDWVHNFDGHSIVTVHQVVHHRDMSEPDTIKEGWSVTGLWFLWSLFVVNSVAVSILLALVPWTSSGRQLGP